LLRKRKAILFATTLPLAALNWKVLDAKASIGVSAIIELLSISRNASVFVYVAVIEFVWRLRQKGSQTFSPGGCPLHELGSAETGVALIAFVFLGTFVPPLAV
jgi:hypothetical protein